MATAVQVQYRRGAASQVTAFTGAQGELVVDTTTNRVVVQDGATAGGWPAAKLSETQTIGRTGVADASYSAAATDRSIAYTALTAARTVTLPAASSFPAGCEMTITDETGNCSATKSITVARAGTDTIDGVANAVLAAAYAGLVLKCNGSNQWTILAQTSPPQLNTVAQGANGSQIQFGVLEQLLTLSGSSTTSTVQIPNRAIVFAVSELVVTAVTGAPSFGVGVSGSATQFGGSLGTSAGSNNSGVIGPTAFYSATSIVITATGGSFTGGTVRISIHYALCNVPTS